MSKRSRWFLFLVGVLALGGLLLMFGFRGPVVRGVEAQDDPPVATTTEIAPGNPIPATAVPPDKGDPGSEDPMEISQPVAVDLEPDAIQMIEVPFVDDAQVSFGDIHPELDRSKEGWDTVLWETFDNNSLHNGWSLAYVAGSHASTWGPDDTRLPQYLGDTDAWTNRWGPGGVDPQFNSYPNNAASLMTYGPFSLVGATDGTLNFDYWLDTQIYND